jgi:hypothetical protein
MNYKTVVFIEKNKNKKRKKNLGAVAQACNPCHAGAR